MGRQWKQWQTILLGSKITADGHCSHEIKRCLLLGRKAMTNLDSILKSKDITDKGPSSQSYGFSSSHVWIWEVDHKEGWELKNWCFQIVVLKKTLENLLDYKETKPVNLTGNQPWIFIGRTDAEAEVQYVFHLMWRAVSLEKILMLRKIEGQRIRGNRRWDGWMASLTQWTWVWANSRR